MTESMPARAATGSDAPASPLPPVAVGIICRLLDGWQPSGEKWHLDVHEHIGHYGDRYRRTESEPMTDAERVAFVQIGDATSGEVGP